MSGSTRFKSSSRKVAANRENARKSTGPRTEQGKVKSSRNALRHGFYAESVAIGADETHEFQCFSDALIRGLNPRDIVEFTQAERIAALQWRIGRIQRAETALIETHQIRLFKSMRSRVNRLEELREEQQDWDPEDRTFTEKEEQDIELTNDLYKKLDDIEPSHALMVLAEEDDDSGAIERLSRLEQRLDTQLQRAWKQMRELQKPEREVFANPSDMILTLDRQAEKDAAKEQAEDESEPATDSETVVVRNEANEDAIVEDTTVYASNEVFNRGMGGSPMSCCQPAEGHSEGQSSHDSQDLHERICE